MNTKSIRKIVKIDEDRCNGCGLCIPNCAEGAIRIINGKARLIGENLCDGLGACLGHCPMDAITVEERPAEEFDELAVLQHLTAKNHAPEPHAVEPRAVEPHQCENAHGKSSVGMGGCPGSMARMLKRPAASTIPENAHGTPSVGLGGSARPSQLGQWPVQLTLVPVQGPMWQDADVLIAADCVPFAYPEFHERLLAGKSLAIACPKLDDVEPYVQKLAAIFAGNTIRSVTVAHMEVPCCSGIVRVVHQALSESGRTDIEVHDVTIGIDGTIKRGD